MQDTKPCVVGTKLYERGGFYAPLVNREEAVVQVLKAFNQSFEKDPSEGMEAAGARPVVSFAGHMYGSGKTVFGQHFAEFLAMNKEFVKQKMAGELLPGSRTLEEGLNALCDETIYVYLDMYLFPTEGERFKYVLFEDICERALSPYSNAEELFVEIVGLIPEGPKEWLPKLLEVTKKKYLFVFIDEIGLLGEPNNFQFKDLQSPSSDESPSAVYRTFFRLLSPLACVNRVLCVVAGRSDAIVRQQQNAMPSRVQLEFLKLDPFSLQTTDAYIRNAKYKDVPLQNVVFPHIPHGMDYLSRIVWEYTSGVPIYILQVLTDLANNCLSQSEWRDLSEEQLREKVETISPERSLVVDTIRRRPERIVAFSSMLLASIFEIPIDVRETYIYSTKLDVYSDYALDIASYFGFYHSQGDTEDTFKLVYPQIVLNYIAHCRYSDVPIIGVINDFVTSMRLYHIPLSRGIIFEMLTLLVLYLRVCSCFRMNEMSIFRKTWIETCEKVTSSRVHRYRPKHVASFHSNVSGDIHSTGQTCHPSVWKAFFDTYLSQKDGFFISAARHSGGPDWILCFSNEAKTKASNSPSSFKTENVQASLYLIGISLKCYDMAQGAIGCLEIKEEAEKFLIPISEGIDLKEENIVAIQLIISTNYSKEISKRFTDNQNWVLDSGVYYENDEDRELNFCPHNSPSPHGSQVHQWLSIPDRCQLVVCSTASLQTLFGRHAYYKVREMLEVGKSSVGQSQLRLLSFVLDSWLSSMPCIVSEYDLR